MVLAAAAVDINLANISNYLIYSAIAVYLLAMFAYCAEWAFGSRGTVARLSAAYASPAGAGSRKTAPQGQHVGGTDGAVSTLVRTAPVVVTNGGRGGHDRAPADGPGAAGTDEQADLLGRIAVSLTALGFLLHAGGVLTRGLSVMRLPWGNMYEFSCVFALTVVGAHLALLAAGKNVRWLGLPILIAALLILGLAVTVLYTASEQLVPALHSYWLGIHVSAMIICAGVFCAGFAVTVSYLAQESRERRLAAGEERGSRLDGILERLPAAANLDRLSYRLNALVFPLWTFAVIAGSIWAEKAWGRYWNWDPKETWSFITWIAYAGYLHARSTAGWKGRKAAYLALVGFACVLFNFYGVNIFVTGKHSYAGV
ncbi:c-type cytochrome biogenesis protein CcsB [Streptomyces sp. NPDC001093]|uniref:c-type cytochrome biogenesis protein CcsB n=1 Tax=Streptomyces sp. NPDC001093 TaxID=3154376 RepID=UPI0033274A14